MNSISEIKKSEAIEQLSVIQDTAPVEEEKDLVILSLKEFDQKLKEGCDMAHLVALAGKIMALLHYKGARNDKLFTLDKKADLDEFAKKSEQTYNGRHVFLLTVAMVFAGAITMGGGGMSFAGAFSTGDKLTKLGAAAAGIGQGLGMVPGPFEKYFEAQRVKYSHLKQMHQHQFDDRNQSHQTDKRHGKDALQKAEQAFQALHSSITDLLRSSRT